MPELELDTVWEAGEMSTGDEIDGSSSVSSSKNNEGTVVLVDQPNISRPSHKLHNEATSVATKNILQVVPNKVDVNKVETTIVHERPDMFETRSKSIKSISSQLSNNENLSCHSNSSASNSDCNGMNFCEMQKTYENTIQIKR